MNHGYFGFKIGQLVIKNGQYIALAIFMGIFGG